VPAAVGVHAQEATPDEFKAPVVHKVLSLASLNVTVPDAPGVKVASKVFDWPRSTVVSVVKVTALAILVLVTEDERPSLVTVIVTVIRVPISAEVRVYVEFVAFVIAVPARRH
jgi:hypothetical protein